MPSAASAFSCEIDRCPPLILQLLHAIFAAEDQVFGIAAEQVAWQQAAEKDHLLQRHEGPPD